MTNRRQFHSERARAVLDDPIWQRVAPVLSSYQQAFHWYQTTDEDGSTPWRSSVIDPATAGAAFRELLDMRAELSSFHDRELVRSMLVTITIRMLDGSFFEPGHDVHRSLPYEPNGRPSTALVSALDLDTLVDDFRELNANRLLTQMSQLEDERIANDRADNSTTLRRIGPSLRAADAVARERGLIDTPGLLPWQLHYRMDGPSLPLVEQGVLPAWMPAEVASTGVMVHTRLAPMQVRLIAAGTLNAALEAAKLEWNRAARLVEGLDDVPAPACLAEYLPVVRLQVEQSRQSEARAALARRTRLLPAALDLDVSAVAGRELYELEARGAATMANAWSACKDFMVGRSGEPMMLHGNRPMASTSSAADGRAL